MVTLVSSSQHQITSSAENLWIETYSKPDLDPRFTQAISDDVLDRFHTKYEMFPSEYLKEKNSKFIKQQQEQLSSEFKTRLKVLKICPDDTKNSFEMGFICGCRKNIKQMAAHKSSHLT